MDDPYEFRFVEKIDDPIWTAVGGGINQFNAQQGGDCTEKSLCFVVYGPGQEIAGGVIGFTYYGWFYLSLMWVKEELRGRGFGSRLLALAEDEARRRGVMHVFLDTFSFQAPEFYQKYGYQVFGELPDFPTGHKRYWLKKEL